MIFFHIIEIKFQAFKYHLRHKTKIFFSMVHAFICGSKTYIIYTFIIYTIYNAYNWIAIRENISSWLTVMVNCVRGVVKKNRMLAQEVLIV